MSLIQDKPVSAFCILCHDADAVLPFYEELLGFKLQRAEESFYSFVRRGSATTLCLWEIRHIARHTDFNAYHELDVPKKVVLSLTCPTKADVDQLYLDLGKTAATLLSGPPSDEIVGFYFADPCGMIWEVKASDHLVGDNTLALTRITLICQNFELTKAFYEFKLSQPSIPAEAGRVTYPAINNTSLSLWDAKYAAKSLSALDFTAQNHAWGAHTAMLAHPFGSFDQLQSAYESLSEKGILFDHAPAFFDWEFNASYFRDPENNIWELFEMPINIEERQLPMLDS